MKLQTVASGQSGTAARGAEVLRQTAPRESLVDRGYHPDVERALRQYRQL